jgi:hypothetical protein
MTHPDLAAAAAAYRAERQRYWINRSRVGETIVQGGGVSALLVTNVQTADAVVVFGGSEERAKAWLDETCLQAALSRLLGDASDELVTAAGGVTVLRNIAECLFSEG